MARHVPTDRLRAFMLEQLKLDEAEHAHIIRCSECARNMAESVLSQAREESDEKDAGRKKPDDLP